MQVTADSDVPKKIIIPSTIFEEMLSHCRKGYPNEACGILAGSNGMVSEIYSVKNIENSPVSYMMEPSEQFRVIKDIRSKGLKMLAIFHSHPFASAYPSEKDVSLAFYDDVIYIIISLSGDIPAVKGYTIREGKIEEVDILR